MMLIQLQEYDIVQHGCSNEVEFSTGLVRTAEGIDEGFSKPSLPRSWSFTFELAAPEMALDVREVGVASLTLDFSSEVCSFFFVGTHIRGDWRVFFSSISGPEI